MKTFFVSYKLNETSTRCEHIEALDLDEARIVAGDKGELVSIFEDNSVIIN